MGSPLLPTEVAVPDDPPEGVLSDRASLVQVRGERGFLGGRLSTTMTPTRDDAIVILEEGHRELRRLADRLSPADLDRPRTIGGGDWSAKILLGHLTAWEEHALEALVAWRAGRGSAIQRALRVEGLGAVNAASAAPDRQRTVDEVLARSEAVHTRLIDALRVIPEADWAAPPTRRARRSLGDTVGALLGGPGGPFEHASAHLPDLARYVGDR